MKTRKGFIQRGFIQRGFTLVEIMLVTLIVAILAIALMLLINPTRQRERVWDIQRKRELEQLRILFEDYFTIHLEYPNDQLVCFDSAQEDEYGVCSCHICGLERDPGTFSSLLKLLYCDPEHGRQEYLYKYDCVNANPLWYVIYAQMKTGPGAASGLTCNYAVSNDPLRIEANPVGCTASGPPSGGEATPTPGGGPSLTPGGPSITPEASNTPTVTPTPPACPDDPTAKYCRLGGICNICGYYANCLNPSTCDQPPTLFSDGNCTNRCLNYGGFGPSSTPIPTPTTFQLGSCPLDPVPKYCKSGGSCNNCGLYESCLNSPYCDDPLILYGNPTCNGICYEE